MTLVRESIAFQRGGDSKGSLGIGRRALIKEWFETWAPDAEYTIDDNLNVSVWGSLYLYGTGIKELPMGLSSVVGCLDLRGTLITKLPEGLSVGADLDLRGTPIRELPKGLRVGGSLYLRGTNITKLPEGLSVGGYLDLRGTNITKLPKSLKVVETIYKDF